MVLWSARHHQGKQAPLRCEKPSMPWFKSAQAHLGSTGDMALTPITDRTECRYCERSFGSPQDRLDHEADCFWGFMQ